MASKPTSARAGTAWAMNRLRVMRLRTRRFTPLAEVANTLFRVGAPAHPRRC